MARSGWRFLAGLLHLNGQLERRQARVSGCTVQAKTSGLRLCLTLPSHFLVQSTAGHLSGALRDVVS